MNKKKTLLQWILQNILESQAFQRAAKFIEMKGIVVLVKVDEMCNILKSLSDWLLVQKQPPEMFYKKSCS